MLLELKEDKRTFESVVNALNNSSRIVLSFGIRSFGVSLSFETTSTILSKSNLPVCVSTFFMSGYLFLIFQDSEHNPLLFKLGSFNLNGIFSDLISKSIN